MSAGILDTADSGTSISHNHSHSRHQSLLAHTSNGHHHHHRHSSGHSGNASYSALPAPDMSATSASDPPSSEAAAAAQADLPPEQLALEAAHETAVSTALAYAFVYESRSFPPEMLLESHRRTAAYFHSVAPDVGAKFDDLCSKFMARRATAPA